MNIMSVLGKNKNKNIYFTSHFIFDIIRIYTYIH